MSTTVQAPPGHVTYLPCVSVREALARELQIGASSVNAYLYGEKSVPARAEAIVRVLKGRGELTRARGIFAGLIRALNDEPCRALTPALLVQEASACGDLEAARAAFQANMNEHTWAVLDRAIRTHVRTESEVEAGGAARYR